MVESNTTLIVGLGNPGKQFIKTRHNIGFRMVDYFREHNDFPKWERNTSFQSNISKKKISNQNVILAQPQTFMNNSGLAVGKIKRKFKIKDENIVICHDDLDIDFGIIKISQNKKSAGHKGVESIIKSIKNKGLTRIRFGTKPKYPIKNPRAFVLENFSKDEEQIIKILLPRLDQILAYIIENGINKTIPKYGKLSIKKEGENDE